MSEDAMNGIEGLKDVSSKAAAAYAENTSNLVEFVNREMTDHPDIKHLIGGSQLRMMYDNHRNHAAFMSTVFTLGYYELFDSILPWVYRTYHNHGFNHDYFPIALAAWVRAVEHFLEPSSAFEITTVYRWMMSGHDSLMNQAVKPFLPPSEVDESWREVQQHFLEALLKGDHRACIRLARQHTGLPNSKATFFLQVVQPSLYQVGFKWETGEISVAREHLASAIVARVMSSISLDSELPDVSRGRAVVTAAPNEFHEIGAWMVADCLEADGWDVDYLGANMPLSDLFGHLADTPPSLLAISIAMPFNLENAAAIVRTVRGREEYSRLKVMVGGLAFVHLPDFWKTLGADGYAPDCAAAVNLARQWAC
jgi:methanogenic corrinoid protein MtbC1